MIGKIIEKKQVAENTLLVSLSISKSFNFKPGQYCFITLIKPSYKDKRGPAREFSIVSSPNGGKKITITTRITKSGFKKDLSKLNIGDKVKLEGPFGHFILPENIKIPIVFIAGGIGITPFMSMLSYILEKKLSYKLTLIYSNDNIASAAYFDKVQEFAQIIPNMKLIMIMSKEKNWKGGRDRIDSQFIKKIFPKLKNQKYMVVGSPDMVFNVQRTLFKVGIEPGNVIVEDFTGY